MNSQQQRQRVEQIDRVVRAVYAGWRDYVDRAVQPAELAQVKSVPRAS